MPPTNKRRAAGSASDNPSEHSSKQPRYEQTENERYEQTENERYEAELRGKLESAQKAMEEMRGSLKYTEEQLKIIKKHTIQPAQYNQLTVEAAKGIFNKDCKKKYLQQLSRDLLYCSTDRFYLRSAFGIMNVIRLAVGFTLITFITSPVMLTTYSTAVAQNWSTGQTIVAYLHNVFSSPVFSQPLLFLKFMEYRFMESYMGVAPISRALSHISSLIVTAASPSTAGGSIPSIVEFAQKLMTLLIAQDSYVQSTCMLLINFVLGTLHYVAQKMDISGIFSLIYYDDKWTLMFASQLRFWHCADFYPAVKDKNLVILQTDQWVTIEAGLEELGTSRLEVVKVARTVNRKVQDITDDIKSSRITTLKKNDQIIPKKQQDLTKFLKNSMIDSSKKTNTFKPGLTLKIGDVMFQHKTRQDGVCEQLDPSE